MSGNLRIWIRVVAHRAGPEFLWATYVVNSGGVGRNGSVGPVLHYFRPYTEQALLDSGVPFTILRNNSYTENYLGSILQASRSGTYGVDVQVDVPTQAGDPEEGGQKPCPVRRGKVLASVDAGPGE